MEKIKHPIQYLILILIVFSIFLLMIYVGMQTKLKNDPSFSHPSLNLQTPKNQPDSIKVIGPWKDTEFFP